MWAGVPSICLQMCACVCVRACSCVCVCVRACTSRHFIILGLVCPLLQHILTHCLASHPVTATAYEPPPPAPTSLHSARSSWFACLACSAQIILMIYDDVANNEGNPFAGKVRVSRAVGSRGTLSSLAPLSLTSLTPLPLAPRRSSSTLPTARTCTEAATRTTPAWTSACRLSSPCSRATRRACATAGAS